MRPIQFICIPLCAIVFAMSAAPHTSRAFIDESQKAHQANSDNAAIVRFSHEDKAQEMHGQGALPARTGFVNDFARAFDDEEKRRLEARLGSLLERGKIDIAVVTVETTGAQSVQDYSLALARGWRVGGEGAQGGLLLLLSIKDRKWWMQKSRQLGEDLSNEDLKRFGELMTPLLKKQRYAEGVEKCLAAIIARLEERRGFKLDG